MHLVMRRPVDDHLPHPVVARVVLIGFRIEPAVSQAESPVAETVAYADVDSHRPGVVDVLVLAGLDGIVFDDVFSRRLIVGNRHERDHGQDRRGNISCSTWRRGEGSRGQSYSSGAY